MASIRRISSHAAEHLGPGETIVAAVNTQPRGMWKLVGPLAGVGAAIGYVIATAGASSYLQAAIGGGLGGGLGAGLGIAIAGLRFRSRSPFGTLYLTLARTQSRILAYRRSGATSRPGELLADLRLDDVQVDLGTAWGFLPRPLIVSLADGGRLEFEVARPERPERFVDPAAHA